MRRKVVYVAGPFRAKDGWKTEQNVRRAEELCYNVWKAGAVGVCPHTNSRFFDGALPDATWLDGYIELLSRCDALIAVSNWQDSKGTTAEIRYCEGCDKPVFYDMGALKKWLEVADGEDT